MKRARSIVFVVALGLSSAPRSLAQDYRGVDRALRSIDEDVQTLAAASIAADPSRSSRWVAQRISDADVYMRLSDYLRATIVLTDVVEHHGQHPAAGEARLRLADALFAAGDLFGARTRYREVLDRANGTSQRAYAERAIGRLVEIALRTRSFDGVERYFDRFGDPGSEGAAAATYFRAKYVFGRAVPESVLSSGRVGDRSIDTAQLDEARRLFAQVAPRTTYAPQARYFSGVVSVLLGDPLGALPSFRAATEIVPESSEHRRVVELSWLAIGRVHHALRSYPESIEAYQRVPRTSTMFPRALFEAAWVYVAADDPASALRSLEVLAAAAPNSPLVPESQLVRANLLLRRQRFDEAAAIFNEVRETVAPIEVELSTISREHADLPAYFAEIARSQREIFSVDVLLPASARAWSEPDAEFERAAAVLSDLSLTRRLVRETSELCDRLEVALASSTIGNVFSDVRGQLQLIEVIRTKASLARADVAEAEARAGGQASPELEAARARRRELATRLRSVPSSSDALDARDGRQVGEIRRLSRILREVEVEIAGLEARITAMEHVLSTSPMADASGQSAVRAELGNHQASVAAFRGQVDQLRQAIELARLDVGVGDDDYRADAALRAAVDAAVLEERRLSGATQQRSGGDTRLANLVAVESRLVARERELDAAVSERTSAIRTVGAEEKTNIERYRATLGELENESEVVVGGIAFNTFVRVVQRFRDIVLRADVGHVDIAWMRREQHRERLDAYTQSRGIELEEIDSEYADIIDRGRSGGGSP